MRLSKSKKKGANGIAIIAFAILIAATAISPFFSGIAFASSQQTPSTCTYGSINTYNWVSINMLVVLAIMVIGGIIYAIGGVMPARTGEKFRGMAKYEFAEGLISLLIIAILLAFSSSICSFTQSMSQSLFGAQFSDPFQFGQYYVGTLLFAKGTSILTQLYSISVTFYIWGLVLSGVLNPLMEFLSPSISAGSVFSVTLGFSATIENFFTAYSTVFSDIYAALIMTSFGGLFLLFLTIPIVKAISLTVLVPVAIAMRSIGFAGPRLREASNSFLALGIALYFIFPMTLIFNAYTISWIYCTSVNGVSVPASMCMPSSMSQYVGTYDLNKFSTGSLFASNSVSLTSGALPTTISIPSSVFGLLWSSLPISEIMYAPSGVQTLGNIVAQYLFEGIVLVALDMAITIGFALGLTKGLNSISNILGGGSVWKHE